MSIRSPDVGAMPADEECLLSSSQDESEAYTRSSEQRQTPDRLRSLYRRFLWIHLCTFFCYSALAAWVISSRSPDYTFHVFERDSIRTRSSRFPSIDRSPFFSGSNEAIDEAFENILKHPQLRVTSDELEVEHKNSLKLQDSGGHLVWIGAQHDVHCLQLLRKAFHRKEYYEDSDEHALAQLDQHTDHCLYQLLQTVLCFGDTRLMTFEWNANLSKPILSLSATTDERQCVDWDHLQDSLSPRAISESEMSNLKNPLIQ